MRRSLWKTAPREEVPEAPRAPRPFPDWSLESCTHGYVVEVIGRDDFYERIALGDLVDGWPTPEDARREAARMLRELADHIEANHDP